MITLDDLFDHAALAAAIAAGYVRVQTHPAAALDIYNYTEKAQFDGAWDGVTLTCRGLIADRATGMVVARPLPKFFNYGQPGAPACQMDAPVAVTDKADGSLGVLYHDGDGWAVATRGSFASDQAAHATEILRQRYPEFVPPPGQTVLVEIIYPANRIVLDYGSMDDLVLLGVVDNATGRTSGPAAVPDWPGPVIESLPFGTLAEALAAPPRDNREGLVVHFLQSDHRIKIKYAEYVRLHRLVTGLNARVVWECLAGGGDLGEIIEPLPDEFHPWVRQVADSLTTRVGVLAGQIEAAYQHLITDLPAGWGRKEFALAAVPHPERAALFMRLDGKDYRAALWQRVRPAGDHTPDNGPGGDG
jgi:RNA ligase